MADAGIWFRFVLAALACWRVTHLLAVEDGPAGLLARLRARLGSTLAGRLMDCFQCLSMWVAAPLAFWLASRPLDRVVAWLALSGAACLLERLGQEPVVIEKLPESSGEEQHGVLWTEAQRSAQPEPAGDAHHIAAGGGGGHR